MATNKPIKKEKEVVETKKEVSILSKRITEKTGILSNKFAYTFIVPMDANKSMIISAFKKEYKKNPVKVSIARLPSKPLFRAGRPAWKSGYKKAVVTLKESDKIEFM